MMGKLIQTSTLTFILIAAFMFASFNPNYAQSDPATNFKNRVQDYLTKYPEEKLFLHISKPHYLTGETLWFSVFHFSSLDHQPFALSKVVYVELVDGDNQPVVQTKIKIDNSGGSGSIYLPTTLNSGNYRVIAYTKWMRNFDEALFFSEDIQIINPFKRLNLQSKAGPPVYDLQFFPEGGNLINGARSRVGFKATDQFGKGVQFNGVLLTANQDTVISFSPNRFGIGSFEIEPEAGAEYQGILFDENGIKSIHKFPEIKESGLIMRMEPTGNGYTARIIEKQKSEPSKTLYLSGLSRNRFTYFQSKTMINGSVNFDIPENSLNEGINQFTLFDQRGIPVCERKVFRFPEDELNITATIANSLSGPREQVEIEIETSDSDRGALKADLSLSVYRYDSNIPNEQSSFRSHLWLLSELKGDVENPDYYFLNKNNLSIKKDMDNLMLSQGWSKYNLQEILKEEEDSYQYLPEFIDHLFTAKVISKSNGTPLANQVATLSFPDQFALFFPAKSDSAGGLTFQTWNVYGSKTMVLGVKKDKNDDLEIHIDEQFADLNPRPVNRPFFIASDLESFLIGQSINMQIDNAFDTPFKQAEVPDTTSFYGIPDASYLLDDYTRFPVMEEVMREYVYGVNVRRENGKFVFKVLNIPRNEIMNDGPLVLLDGVPVYDIDELMSIDPLKLRKIDVVHRKYLYGSLDCNGILAFYSYNSDLADLELSQETIQRNYQGFQVSRTFYSPKYNTNEALESRLPDYRNQLFWAPKIVTNKDGIVTVKFFTSDTAGAYFIQIHGLGSNGKAGSFSGKIEVRSQ